MQSLVKENPQPTSLPYHCLPVDEVARSLQVNPAGGLSATEVLERQSQFGRNEMPAAQSQPWWQLLLQQFFSLIVALLAVAALIAWFSQNALEAGAILVVLLFNGIVGFLTEWRAEKALTALRQQARTMARVRRDAREILLDAAELVPGDLLVLNAGDAVPADARLYEVGNLRVAEAALTGESVPVEKNIAPVADDAPLAERHSMLYLGTAITAGHAIAIVTDTGAATELGKIGHLVASTHMETTPLKRRLDEMGRRLVYLVIVIGALVMLAGWMRGENILLMAEVGISLAVAAIPEALPAVTTLILALGVLQMARKNALVRHLPAVETLGSTTIICTDKTGTLTENRMQVREFCLANGEVKKLNEETVLVSSDECFKHAIRIAVLCNEAAFTQQPNAAPEAIGDPTETALLWAAHELSINLNLLRTTYPKLAEIPFHTETRHMLTLHKTPQGNQLAALKGAPSAVLPHCKNYLASDATTEPLDEATKKLFLALNEEMAARALRVLALAEKTSSETNPDHFAAQEPQNDYTLLGFVGMSDPLRAEVPAAIAEAHQAGIRVVIMTGDQINTARALAQELQLNQSKNPVALHARELQTADESQIAKLAQQTDVFARVSPADKLQIVQALQSAHEIVAVTGDGVNDAPALKRADIGIAMGLRGTEVAKEAADIVLTDDNFATIIKAVESGRTIYANIIKFVHLMFSKNLGAVLVIFVAILANLPLPLLPLQILWINMVTDVFPALALALEPADPNVMQHPPRNPRAPLLSRPFLILILWQAVLLAAIILGAYIWALHEYGAGAQARTVTLFTLIGSQLGHTFNCRSRTRSILNFPTRNYYIWGAVGIVLFLQLLSIYLPPLAHTLALTPLFWRDWLIVVTATLFPILVVELTKYFARTRKQ